MLWFHDKMGPSKIPQKPQVLDAVAFLEARYLEIEE
jgi:hypothetical protein